MIENERLSKILEILENEKFCTTEYLANTLYVVPVTIRRDLKKLEQQGLINRCYGGASIVSEDSRFPSFIVRKNSDGKVKRDLAKEALKLISPGTSIMLDSSSTASYIAELLTYEMNVTVITSGMRTAMILAEKKIPTYITGGMVASNHFSLTGALALKSVASLHADFLFFSAAGINSAGDISTTTEEEWQVLQAMISCAKKCYFICDGSKMGKTFLYSVCNVKDIDGFISDQELP